MKKLIILAALALCACGAEHYVPTEEQTAKWTDPETGCVYYVYHRGMGNTQMGSLSIRYLETGLPDCPGTRLSLESPVAP